MSKINPDEQRLMTIKEVAARSSSSVRQVWRLIARGDLAKPVYLGRSARIQGTDWDAFLEKIRRARDGGADNHATKGDK
jgi:predicted DNA-binding transcriptional regulator AlpA